MEWSCNQMRVNSWFRIVVAFAAVLALIGGSSHVAAAAGAAVPHPVQVEPTLIPDRIVLNPTDMPFNSQTVTWRTNLEASESQIQYAHEDSNHTGSITSRRRFRTSFQREALHHSVTLIGLEPATQYTYRVGSDTTGWSDWYEFTTASKIPSPFSFLYFGDAQNGLDDVWPQVAQASYSQFPDAALSLHAGDMINNSDRDEEWAQWFAAQGDVIRTRNVLTTIGNHEYKGDGTLEQYRAHFAYPGNGLFYRDSELWFTDYQDVRFISLNANVLVGIDQVLWLRHVLENNPNTWTVVTFHQPVFSGSTGRDNFNIRLTWQPILEEFNVDLVLQGHDHVYARGHMGHHENVDGTHGGPVYVVAVAGSKSYDLALDGDNVWTHNGAVRQVAAEQMSTYQHIEVDRNRLTYRSIVGRVGEDPQPGGLTLGDTLDGFTITKAGRGQKIVTNEVPDLVASTVVPGTPYDIVDELVK